MEPISILIGVAIAIYVLVAIYTNNKLVWVVALNYNPDEYSGTELMSCTALALVWPLTLAALGISQLIIFLKGRKGTVE